MPCQEINLLIGKDFRQRFFREKLNLKNFLKGFPLLWHHIDSPEKCEKDGTSYMNFGELELVLVYVKRIINELNVKPVDIGIISPYTYQVNKHDFLNFISIFLRLEDFVIH